VYNFSFGIQYSYYRTLQKKMIVYFLFI